MIIGVDIGGTKTAVASFTESGKLLEEKRFETPKDYDDFLKMLELVANRLEVGKAKVACVAVPGFISRKEGVVFHLGNLPWQNKSIRRDISEILGIPVYIENDSKLAALSEARIVKNEFSRVLYITLSTGINSGLVINGELSIDVIDSETGKMPLMHEGKYMAWEDFASGRAFYNKYGQKAVDVEDDEIWKEYSNTVNAGLGVVCAAYQPEAIIFGGGLGQRLRKFKPYLEEYLKANLHPLIRQPKALLSTHYRGQSVIYGCYSYAKDKLA
jgi:predicted NBD/HSP70 family sugar kinase